MRTSNIRPASRLLALSACLGLLAVPAVRPARAQPAENAQAKPQIGPIQELYRQRKFEEAISKANEMRDTKPSQATPDSEYWAARSLQRLDQNDESRTRLANLAKTFPDSERGQAADIEKSVVLILSLDKANMSDDERATAARAARELESTASRYPEAPAVKARALFIAGNSWRMAEEDEAAESAYSRCAALEDTDDYAPKCIAQLGALAARQFDVDKARKAYTRCTLEHPDSPTAAKCVKSLNRLDLVGFPAEEFQVETWLNGPPVTLQELRGHVVLVFFFATWCPHCKEALPSLSERMQRFSGKPVMLVGMTANMRGQTTEIAKVFAADPQWKINYPAAVDDRGRTSRQLGASGVPTLVLIDKVGNVRWVDHPNLLTNSMIERLLAE